MLLDRNYPVKMIEAAQEKARQMKREQLLKNTWPNLLQQGDQYLCSPGTLDSQIFRTSHRHCAITFHRRRGDNRN